MDTEPAPRTILRYANRKMYDNKGRRHVTADDIVALVREGTPFRIIGCTDKLDQTQTVLCSVLNRISRARGAVLDEALLLRAIKSYRLEPAGA